MGCGESWIQVTPILDVCFSPVGDGVGGTGSFEPGASRGVRQARSEAASIFEPLYRLSLEGRLRPCEAAFASCVHEKNKNFFLADS